MGNTRIERGGVSEGAENEARMKGGQPYVRIGEASMSGYRRNDGERLTNLDRV